LTAHAATNDLAKLFDDLFQSAKRVQRDALGCVAVGVVASGEGSAGGAGGGGDGAGVDVEIAAVVVASFALVRAAGGFMVAGANGASSALTGSGAMTVIGALPESPDCIEPDSFTAMRTGTLWG
jgi:hypothetical protein